MSSNIKLAYGGDTSITLSTSGPTNGSNATSSSAVDNTTNLFFDAIIGIQVTTAASSTLSTGHVDVYVAPSADGTNYADATNDILVGSLATAANATTYIAAYSVAQACGGVMPYKWNVRIQNNSGATVSSLTAHYNGVYATAS